MKMFSHCTHCGGSHLTEKTVEKIIRGGNDTVSVTVPALVCLDCGERLYAAEIAMRLDDARKRLESGDVSGLEPIGHLYKYKVA